MKKKSIAAILALITVFSAALCGCAAEKPSEQPAELRVVSYVVLLDDSALDNFDPSHLKDLTDVILFGNLAGMRGNGEVELCDGFGEIVARMKAMDPSGRLRWHVNFDLLSEKDKKLEMRPAFRGKTLPGNIRAVLEQYDLDGAFFDYEFPMEWDAKLDFSIFLTRLRKALGNDYLIGAALQPWCARFLPSAIRAIDMVELMSYDNWDENGFHSTLELTKQDVKKMVRLGYKRQNIDLGVPFYARPTTKEAHWYDYSGYWDQLDSDGLVPVEEDKLVASFNTPETIYEKTKWAMEEGLGGVMVWHYACDVPAENEASLFSAITRAKSSVLAAAATTRFPQMTAP